MSLTPQEMASGQASDISSLTSLGNSSARKEEVMDLSPMLGKKYGPIWTELQRGKRVGGALPVSLKLQKALVSQLYFPHPEDAEPMRRVPVTHHHAPSLRAICCFLHVPSTPTFTDIQHCVCCLSSKPKVHCRHGHRSHCSQERKCLLRKDINCSESKEQLAEDGI